MNKPNLAQLAKDIHAGVSKHSPEILTGLGIAGMIATTVLAVKATPKALRLMNEAEREKRDLLTPKEVVKTCWKCYIPAAISGAASITCLIGASSVNVRRTAALAAACQISETALSEYREQVVDAIGEKKEQNIRDKVAEKQLEKHPVEEFEVIQTGRGTSRCFDPLSGRYFQSDIELLHKAENIINKGLLHDIGGYASVNDFYDELGLPHTDLGEHMGWDSDNLINLDITAHVASDGKPAIVMGHYNPPRYERY